jgi:hypothetical protein
VSNFYLAETSRYQELSCASFQAATIRRASGCSMKSRWRAREANSDVGISGVVAARPMSPSLDAMQAWLATLEQGLAREERTGSRDRMKSRRNPVLCSVIAP